ncbi:MAG: hypothetical protein WD077_11070 [Bacteroidia bacterium]
MRLYPGLLIFAMLLASGVQAQDSENHPKNEIKDFQSFRGNLVLNPGGSPLLSGFEFSMSYYKRNRWAPTGLGAGFSSLAIEQDSFRYKLNDIPFYVSSRLPFSKKAIAPFLSADLGLSILLSDKLELHGQEVEIHTIRSFRLIAPFVRISLGVSFLDGDLFIDISYMKKQNQIMEDHEMAGDFWSIGSGINL